MERPDRGVRHGFRRGRGLSRLTVAALMVSVAVGLLAVAPVAAAREWGLGGGVGLGPGWVSVNGWGWKAVWREGFRVRADFDVDIGLGGGYTWWSVGAGATYSPRLDRYVGLPGRIPVLSSLEPYVGVAGEYWNWGGVDGYAMAGAEYSLGSNLWAWSEVHLHPRWLLSDGVGSGIHVWSGIGFGL